MTRRDWVEWHRNYDDPDSRQSGRLRALPGFCRRGTEVVWTRHRRPPDLVPTVLDWLAGAGFTALLVDDAADHAVCVGRCRYEGDGGRLAPGERLFTFR
jgi:hypothetical protein